MRRISCLFAPIPGHTFFELKEVVAEQALELRLLKKSMTGDGGEEA